MRVPILILCLAVIYGTRKVYCEKSLIESITNVGDYGKALEKSLLRDKMCDPLSSPLVKIGLKMLGIRDTTILKDISELVHFINGLMNEQNVCPKIEKFSLKLFEHAALHPIQAAKTILCYASNIIGNQGRVILRKSLKIFISFVRKIFLPGLHKVLNSEIVKILALYFPSINGMIMTFNILYKILTLVGFIE